MTGFNPRVRLPGFVSSCFKQAIWRMNVNEKVVYLTFDDGPIPELTPWVLELLRKEDLKATFFCVGENVKRYPELYHQILNEGHSVGNHTFNHWQGLKTNDQEFYNNIELAAKYIDSDLFRPPHGWLKLSQYAYLKNRYRIVMWDLISCDYDSKLSSESVFRNVRQFARNGSILTFHDSIKARRNLMEALPLSIRWLKEQGYRFEALPYNKRNGDATV